MSLLFIPLGLVVWVICYGPVTGDAEEPAPDGGPVRTGARSRR